METDWKKKYEEAIKKVELLRGYSIEGNAKIDEIFPELAESEDEKIRKEIVSFIWAFWVDHRDSVPQTSKWLAWLEKQKDSPMPEDTVVFQKGVEEGRRLEREEQKPTPDWMPKFLDELRSKKNYFDWDEHRDIEGHILAIIKWIAPDYFHRKEKEQKPLPGFDNLTPDEKMNHPLYLEGFDAGREVGRVEAEQKPEWSKEDEAIYDSIIREIVDKDMAMTNLQKRWLRSLKNIGNSPKSNTNSLWKPSKEELEFLSSTIDVLRKGGHAFFAENLESIRERLRKLI